MPGNVADMNLCLLWGTGGESCGESLYTHGFQWKVQKIR